MSAGYLIAPDPAAPRLTRAVTGVDHEGRVQEVRVVEERPLTIYLNAQEIVTAMTIGDYPEYLAVGYLLNQGMLRADDTLTGDRLRRRARDGGGAHRARDRLRGEAAQEDPHLGLRRRHRLRRHDGGARGADAAAGDRCAPPTSTRWRMSINTTPSLYLEAGAIHGTVLCQGARPLVYMEDVGRHNAVDKIAGWMAMEGVGPADKLLYTTGRLTSEMVIKTALMGIPALASRSGFTAWGVEIARQVGLTLIGRMRGKRFLCLAGAERLVRDADPAAVPEEARHLRRKSADDAA